MMRPVARLRRFLRRSLLLAACLAPPGTAAAADGFADMLRYLFIPTENSSALTVLDTQDDELAGELEAGLVPLQLEGSGEPARLVAIDGRTPRLSVIDPASRQITPVPLPFTPRRILVSGKGGKAAVADPASGQVAIIDLARGAVLGRIDGSAPLQDMLFSGDGERLYIAAQGSDGIGIFEAAGARRLGKIELAGVTALTHAPSGRTAFVKTTDKAAIGLLDLREARQTGVIEASDGVDRAYPSATGINLILPDSRNHTVAFASGSSLKTKAVLKAAAGLGPVYSGWFDSVAFIPSAAEQAVLTYDQDRLTRESDIPLPGLPGRGVVTPDGRKLYLPIAEGRRLAVIDAEHRRLAGLVKLKAAPTAAVMVRGFGICN